MDRKDLKVGCIVKTKRVQGRIVEWCTSNDGRTIVHIQSPGNIHVQNRVPLEECEVVNG